ncbi:MAG: hypothetical protein ACHQ2E_05975 [Gemmatimonadales bacterium]
MKQMPGPAEPGEFSLVLGGPLYQLWRRSHLSGDALQLVHRRIVALVTVAWAPLLALAIVEGRAWGGGVELPFLHDIETNARLLVALPLLIVSELVVHERLRQVVGQFLDEGLIPEQGRTQFHAAVASAARLRNSIVAEVGLIALVYVVGIGLTWRTELALNVSSWYAVTVDGRSQPSLAGWWQGLVSLPLFQFLLLRWYFRFGIWTRFLWQVSRIDLHLVPTHPDRAGGLGFLAMVGNAFAPLLAAQGVLLAGAMANRILHTGATLSGFKVELVGLAAVMLLAVLGPLLVFTPQLAAARRGGLRKYGSLAQRYVREFDDKWVRGDAPAGEPLLGSGDIQSLADMGNSFEVVREMQLAPFGLRTVLQLAATTLAPVVPLLLTVMPPAELISRLLKIVF